MFFVRLGMFRVEILITDEESFRWKIVFPDTIRW